ncbi:DNA polymerase I [Staphylococcus epidermidis APO35]|nr:DNA polymerase I [Staphylococcus epidermidis CIM28]ESR27521.1 DNA polymerase I [Staphylococcus epidermidis APO35]ESU03161.1 DNA polymerase I [Staphylococcus epidermidis CIM37]ESV09252.1 DNA polymerase I [Staphylococcus epidermidis MC28]ESV14549.1 DNA polymerase I [Staphylococcus epidermidis WI05]ESV20854.1 DNA polymerase I [Staphylococcus epidermidis WI09]ESV25214.1 DNA polymerase I [Staphylococcus epidermidis CIM40]ESV29888.1 DNA polymerase I [Staphylococcus epidermidis APO27]ESV37218.1
MSTKLAYSLCICIYAKIYVNLFWRLRILNKLVLIDGNSLSFRAFYALPLLSNHAGIHTNAVYGFAMLLEKIIKEEKPNHFLVAFDAGKTTFRHSKYSEYKGGRQKTPPELSEQFPYIRQLLDAYHIKRYELDNYEADDIIGTLSRQADEADFETIIITGDRDLTQLATDNVTIYYTKKGVTDVDHYTPEFIAEKYQGLVPKQIIDMKGLMGDTSDNIPGVAGVGEKTAIKLLNQFESVEGVYEHIEEVTAKKLKEKLINSKADALMSKDLATINVHSPIEVSLEDTKLTLQDDTAEKIELFKKLEFKQLLADIDTPSNNEEVIDKTFEIEQDFQNVDLNDLNEAVIHFELEGTNYLKDAILKFGFYTNHQHVVINADDVKNYKNLVRWLEDKNTTKIVYDAKKTYVSAHRLGINIENIEFDVMLASYIIDPSRSIDDVKSVVSLYGQNYVKDNITVFGKGKKHHIPEESILNEHIASVTEAISAVTPIMKSQLEDYNQIELLKDLELPLARILSEMEEIGIYTDINDLKEMEFEIQKKLDVLISNIHESAGEAFNINSPKQLGVVLFETLQLPVIKKTKTGYSTAVDVLEKLQGEHPIIDDILEYRQLSKLQSTYVEGLQKVISKDHRIHTRFNQTLAQTGRLSSVDPNLQNIPIRLEEGRKIRKAFKPTSKDSVILSADYSQIELRVLAHITQDESLKHAFINGHDIHTATAMKVFNVESDQVDSLMRRQAKAVNFGIVYGISDYGLSQSLGITRKKAKAFIDDYLASFPGVKQYMSDIVKDAKAQGYVETLLHRRRYIPDITSRNFNLRSFAERTAMNTPIQGSAADIIKLAMVKFSEKIKETKYHAKLLLQVHDELIFEIPKSEVEDFSKFVEEIMEQALVLDVPLKVDSNYGATWYDAK